PIAGLAAAFAGVAGGYSANLLIGTIDPLLAGLSQEAARIIQPGYEVNPACNYYFMAASTFFITVIGTWVTEKIVEPRLGTYTGSEKADELQRLSADEKRGVKYAGVAVLAIVGLIVAGLLPQDGFLREVGTGSILKSPFMSGVVVIIFFAAAIAGIAYGIGAKTIKSDADVMKGMSKSMETLGSYIVLVFFAAQFVAFFNWTNLGIISAIKGAQFLQSIGADGIPLMIAFILVSALINLVMGSASAKWAIITSPD
ncbi:MAG: AbgT family transporter, partial [Bacteroidota bacterium]